MKLQWRASPLDCLAPVMQNIQQRELTQELKLGEALPDIGRVLGVWGQGMVRSKQWQEGSVSCSGGVMVWVLYAPEDGSAPGVLDGWVPFQLTWDIPEGTAEGTLRVDCALRFADARSVSPRKVMLRLGVAVSMEAYSPMTAQVFQPEEDVTGVELLKSTYPMTLVRETGEKTFLLDEELTLPEGGPEPEKILCYTMTPRVTDKKVLSLRAVFRGVGALHILGMDSGGRLTSWDMEVSFSQFSQLTGEHSGEAQVDIGICPTSCEAEWMGQGRLRLKCGLVAQYVVTDRVTVELVEDAYSPGQGLDITWEELKLPVVLEARGETLSLRQSLSTPMEQVAEVSCLAEPANLERREDGVAASFTGTAQVLGYGREGEPLSATGRWEIRESLPCHASVRLFFGLPQATNVAAQSDSGGVTVTGGLPIRWTASTWEQLPQIAALELEEQTPPDPDAPSLILRRAGGDRLWDIAKKTGSTVAAIRQATGLEGEPAPNQMLLIPVGGGG